MLWRRWTHPGFLYLWKQVHDFPHFFLPRFPPNSYFNGNGLDGPSIIWSSNHINSLGPIPSLWLRAVPGTYFCSTSFTPTDSFARDCRLCRFWSFGDCADFADIWLIDSQRKKLRIPFFDEEIWEGNFGSYGFHADQYILLDPQFFPLGSSGRDVIYGGAVI